MNRIVLLTIFLVSLGFFVSAPLWRSGFAELMPVLAPSFIGAAFSLFFVVASFNKTNNGEPSTKAD